MDVKELHKQFCTEEFDEYGVISKFEIHCPDHFNFAYDVVDVMAALDPHALLLSGQNHRGADRRHCGGGTKSPGNDVVQRGGRRAGIQLR